MKKCLAPMLAILKFRRKPYEIQGASHPRLAHWLKILVITVIAPTVLTAGITAERPSARTELPISVTKFGGASRYSVMITVNGKPVEAALDTGSVGLRILATAFPAGGRATSRRSSIGFNSGVILGGPVVRAQVRFGGLPETEIDVQRIDEIGCREDVRDCEASVSDPNSYRIMGEGTPGKGFDAILGVGLRPEPLGHPLERAGVTRWIVELPRNPNEGGRVILNPSNGELTDFHLIPFLADRNEVHGCLVAAAFRACGPSMVDTGAPGITLFGFSEGDLPPRGAAAKITLGEGNASVSTPIEIGRHDMATMVRARGPRRDAKPSLSFGVAPYLRWSILYDAERRALGVTERQRAK